MLKNTNFAIVMTNIDLSVSRCHGVRGSSFGFVPGRAVRIGFVVTR